MKLFTERSIADLAIDYEVQKDKIKQGFLAKISTLASVRKQQVETLEATIEVAQQEKQKASSDLRTAQAIIEQESK